MDVMIDLETMSLTPGAAILSIGAVSFNLLDEPGNMNQVFYENVDLTSCLLAGLEIEASTVQWWRDQSVEAKQALLEAERRPLREVLERFSAWYREREAKCVWANGPTADVVWMEAAYRAVGMSPPWEYKDVRCFRTIVDLSGIDKKAIPMRGVEHDALSDAVWQTKVVQTAAQKLGVQR